MIQVNELRIGNNILLLGEVCTIECISNLPKRKEMYWIKTKEFIDTKIIHFKPIPLTEEILLKCGFYYSDDDDEFLEYKVFKSFKFHADYSDKFSCISYRINDTTNEIKFLHQLQNLYWCLCGEELTFNNL